MPEPAPPSRLALVTGARRGRAAGLPGDGRLPGSAAQASTPVDDALARGPSSGPRGEAAPGCDGRRNLARAVEARLASAAAWRGAGEAV